MQFLDWVFPWLLVIGLLFPMRALERWLHQHIFKVGWLLTKSKRTTTILYYLFFLPGIIVNQFTFWMVAGILDVRAARAIKWPEAQEVAELRARFVQIGKNVPGWKAAIIHLSPFFAAIGLIYGIANGLLDLDGAWNLISGDLNRLDEAIGLIAAVPNVWVWVYVIFAVGNTMFPDWKTQRGAYRRVWIAGVITLGILLFVGVAGEVLTVLITGPLAQGLNILALTFGTVIGVDLFITLLLGVFESIYERATGDSATFQSGRFIALKREDRIHQQEEQRAKDAKKQEAEAKRSRAVAGPPSVYKLSFRVPPALDKEAAVIIREDNRSRLPAPAIDEARAGASVVTGTAIARPPALPASIPQPDESPSDD